MLEQEMLGLGVLFFFVIIGGIIANRFKQPIGIGLLLVGALIGPHAFNLIKNETIIDWIVEFGTILLLFIIGLEFVLPKLARIGFKAMMIGILKIGIIFFITYQVLFLIGIPPFAALIIGIMLSLSSTVVIIKILEAKGFYHREEMPLLIGILLIEDIFAVIVLTFLNKAVSNSSLISVIENIIIAITILCFAYFIMLKLSKSIVSWFIENSGEDVVPFIALGLCIGFSGLSFLLGLSAATGAFLAGSIVASLPNVKIFEHAIRPYSSLFACLFFISIGTKVNFASVRSSLLLLGILLAIVIVSRFISVGLISYLFANFRQDQPIFSSIAMISVSEFALLIAKSASHLNLNIDLVSISASIIFVTAIIMSFSVGYYGKVSNILDNAAPREWATKPRSFSKYIKLLFDEIDIQNTDTRLLKKSMLSFSGYLLFALFAFIGWGKAYRLLIENNISSWLVYLSHLAFIIAICFCIYVAYINGGKMKKTLVHILVNSDTATTPRRSRYILNNLIITTTLFIIAVFFPVAIVTFNMPQLANAIPFALLFVCVVRLRKMVTVMHSRGFRPLGADDI
jgi:Kef-type K+ transport system membrane component KefB